MKIFRGAALILGVVAGFLIMGAGPASAGSSGTVYYGASFESGGAAANFQDRGAVLTVYDTNTDGLYAVAQVDRYDTYGVKSYSTGSINEYRLGIPNGVTVAIRACKGGWNNAYYCSAWKKFVA